MSDQGNDSSHGRARVDALLGDSFIPPEAFQGDDVAAALRAFSDVIAEYPGFADVRNKAGLSLALVGRLEEALEQFDAALEINPEYAEAHLNRAIVLNDLERFDEAREAFFKAAEADGKWGGRLPSEIGTRIALAHARLGDLYVDAGQADRAVQEFEEALRLRPTFVDIRGRFAEALIEAGEFARARVELEEILEVNPDLVSARIRYGVALQRLGDREGAVREWKEADRRDPSDSRARAYLASLEGD
jgi:tetratricopeptide (TPR) repeat protein